VVDFEIIDSRENSTIVSTWTEYLCHRKNGDGTHTFAICGYESLAEAQEYYDEDTDEYEIPDEIDGKRVMGIEDDIIVGGGLDYYDDRAITLATGATEELKRWLHSVEWDSEGVLATTQAFLSL
jgi:hypothetical protein